MKSVVPFTRMDFQIVGSRRASVASHSLLYLLLFFLFFCPFNLTPEGGLKEPEDLEQKALLLLSSFFEMAPTAGLSGMHVGSSLPLPHVSIRSLASENLHPI